MKASDYFDAQTNVPTELRTREMELLPVSEREASHWSAGVADVEQLDLLDRTRRRLLAGGISQVEARKELRQGLAKLGYTPEPGTEGTIKDLRSVARQNVYLSTNKAMAAGFKNWSKQQAALKHFPAVRLVRLQARQEKRDWVTRWNDARDATKSEGATRALRSWHENVGEKGPICLANHPMRQALSRFRLPYDPVDYNTGMRWQPASMADAEEAGIIEEGAEEMLIPQVRSVNQALQLRPEIRDDRHKSMVLDRLQGFARWQDDTLIFTDPNGLRPLDPKRVMETIAAPLPPGFEQLQLAAVQDYLHRPGTIVRTPWTNAARDFARLVERVEKEHVADLTGILPLDPADAAEFASRLQAADMSLPTPLQLSSGPVAPVGVRVRVSGPVADLGHVFPEYRPDWKFMQAGTPLRLSGIAEDGTLLLEVVKLSLQAVLALL